MLLYYSTDPTIKTVCTIKQERQEKLNSLLKEWEEMNGIVAIKWQQLYHNALLLEGQTKHLGFDIMVEEADAYAPQRIWVYFQAPGGITIYIEFHELEGLKRIQGIKISYKRAILGFANNEMSFAKRALNILL